jgi:acylphosphatase
MPDHLDAFMKMNEGFHCEVHFSGRVQGVGFRYQVFQIAKQFDVSGYVRNLADGRVQLEAEGDQHEVSAFVSEIAEQLDPFIRKVERSEHERAPRYKGFIIR